jgi:pyruvate-ferredoxin/flavodoxin oxidoreductase
MAVRQTGFALLSSASVQEAHDLALVAQAATLRTRVPVRPLLRRLPHLPRAQHHRAPRRRRAARGGPRGAGARAPGPRALARAPVRPGHRAEPRRLLPGARDGQPVLRPHVPGSCRTSWTRSPATPGGATGLVEYHGHPEAERVVVVMGSGGRRCAETVAAPRRRGERVGVLQVRLYRPFPSGAGRGAAGHRVRAVAVLDRTKEPGSDGEPLYLDVIAALAEAVARGCRETACPGRRRAVRAVLEGVHPGMVAGRVRRARTEAPRRRFTVGITDDVSAAPRLDYDATFDIEDPRRCGPSSTGWARTAPSGPTRTPSRSSAPRREVHAQAYFVYDSKKSGGLTVSHLRFGPHPIRAPVPRQLGPASSAATTSGCSTPSTSSPARRRGVTLLLNAPLAARRGVGRPARRRSSSEIIDKRLRSVCHRRHVRGPRAGLPGRTNTVLQTCFFAISGVLPARGRSPGDQGRDPQDLRSARQPRWSPQRGGRGRRPRGLHEVPVPAAATSQRAGPTLVPRDAPPVRPHRDRRDDGRPRRRAAGERPAGRRHLPQRHHGLREAADLRPRRRLGSRHLHPVRQLQLRLPAQRHPVEVLRRRCPRRRPRGLRGTAQRRRLPGSRYTLQVYVEDCTGCGLCVEACPVSPLVVRDASRPAQGDQPRTARPGLAAERENIAFFETPAA